MNSTSAPMASATISSEMTLSATSVAPTPSAMADRREPRRAAAVHLRERRRAAPGRRPSTAAVARPGDTAAARQASAEANTANSISGPITGADRVGGDDTEHVVGDRLVRQSDAVAADPGVGLQRDHHDRRRSRAG